MHMVEKKKHILMIDDDPTIQRLFGAKLSAKGFEVLYAHDAETGRETARRLSPDLILLDIRMPGMDGFQTAKLLRGEERTKNMPVVFLTNEDLSMEGEKWAKELWVSDYIHKSTDLNEIVSRVKKILKQVETSQQIKEETKPQSSNETKK